MKRKHISPWAWIPTLYFAEGIPYFIVNTISVTMFTRMGVPNGEMALFTSLLYLPWTIKPLWSPFVDIVKTKRWWIFAMQILIAVTFVLLTLSITHPDSTIIQAMQTPIELFEFTVVFFIVLVANCGGLLTPLGDPPLFLLYLRGASFTWFMHLLPEWLFVGSLLLAIYYLLDRFYYFKKEEWTNISADIKEKRPLRVSGNINFVFLLGVVASVAFINQQYIPQMSEHDAPFYIKFLRELVLMVLIALSLVFTKREVRGQNNFTWSPILEVAALFLGIFATMTPALLFLNQHSASLGVVSPAQFYYFTGTLSSFLDNAPTAVAFHSVAEGLPLVGNQVTGISEIILKAISTAAVFFGAMTYIGNGPNFMVKSIAEENNVPMPSFFTYILKFSLPVLLPVYILCQLLFL